LTYVKSLFCIANSGKQRYTLSMVRAVKLEGHLTENRQLTLTIPSEIPAGPVEVLVVSKDGNKEGSLLRFLDELASAPLTSRSSQEIEDAILAERNAWDK
jgi:hypothetical protein